MKYLSMTDDAICTMIADRLRQYRLNRNVSQAELADAIGVSRMTISRFEAGSAGAIKFSALIAVLRELDLLDHVDLLVPEVEVSPVQMMKLKGQQRQKAGSPRKSGSVGKPSEEAEPLDW